MMIDFDELLRIILYVGLIVLVIIVIILGIRLMKTLKKVDGLLDDVNVKITKVNGVFDIIDKTTDYASLISDKILNGIYSFISVFTKRKKGNDNNEEE